MLNNINIRNLKCFKNQSIPFSDITLLTGFNAAGKSTVIQSLLLANQMTRHHADSKYIPLNGEMVKLGTAGDILCEYADCRTISIVFTFGGSSICFDLDASDRLGTAIKVINQKETIESDSTLIKAINEVVYISAMRLGTDDVYPSPDLPNPINADVGFQGQFAPWWFERKLDEEIDKKKLHPKEKAPTLKRQFDAWAGELFPGSQANATRIHKTPLVQLALKTKNTEDWRRPANIGFGLSYAFPILVAGLLAKPGQILIIDSPEAHLHPKGQSKIGEFLSIVAASGVQVLLETHSDHVLNGVRLAVSKNKISPKNVAINFFTPDWSSNESTPQITSLHIDKLGNLSEWPDGFFDQSEKDITTLAGWD